MALHFQQPPASSVEALHAALPRIASRASMTTTAPDISAAVGALLRRRPLGPNSGPATTDDDDAGGDPISAPVHIVGLDQLSAKANLAKTPVKLWSHLLHADGVDAPVAVADIDLKSRKFQAITEGAQITALGRQVRAAENDVKTSGKDYDLAMIRIPAMYLTALWLKGRKGAADVVIPNESPMSPLTPGKHYSLEEFNAALKPVADRMLAETGADTGG